jgi:23S rRNA (adenine2030-N6)-methyltransferase
VPRKVIDLAQMKYRHSFHAGNFADVHKHVALLALLQAMQRKEKGFVYLDTHAGAGRYDLAGADTHHGAEARHGVSALLNAASTLQAEELKNYCNAISAMRLAFADPQLYPGSPWLACHLLRTQDRGVCWELLPSECRSLERALGGFRRVRIECADGYQQLSGVLPPRERRCLLLIDPPYERPAAELDQAIAAVVASLQRLANAVIAVWYPIKDERTLTPWLARVERAVSIPTLSLEMWVHPRDSRVGLNGSGLLVFNPPYQFDQRAMHWQAELQRVLGKPQQSGQSTRWLIAETGLDHASA